MFGLCKRGHSLENAYVYKGCRQCRECRKLRQRERSKRPEYKNYLKNWELSATGKAVRNRYRKRKYGIDFETFAKILHDQNGKCKLCEKTPKHKDLCVDHDHACCPTGSSCGRCVRGIICRRCNVALGMADDSPELLTKMAKYVANFKVGDVTCLA